MFEELDPETDPELAKAYKEVQEIARAMASDLYKVFTLKGSNADRALALGNSIRRHLEKITPADRQRMLLPTLCLPGVVTNMLTSNGFFEEGNGLDPETRKDFVMELIRMTHQMALFLCDPNLLNQDKMRKDEDGSPSSVSSSTSLKADQHAWLNGLVSFVATEMCNSPDDPSW